MRKRIYDDSDSGKFVYGNFRRFMDWTGAENIKSRFDMSNDLYQIWFLDGVAVRYVVHGGMDSHAIVDLFGASEGDISKVEKIILEGETE